MNNSRAETGSRDVHPAITEPDQSRPADRRVECDASVRVSDAEERFPLLDATVRNDLNLVGDPIRLSNSGHTRIG